MTPKQQIEKNAWEKRRTEIKLALLEHEALTPEQYCRECSTFRQSNSEILERLAEERRKTIQYTKQERDAGRRPYGTTYTPPTNSLPPPKPKEKRKPPSSKDEGLYENLPTH